MSHHVQQDGQDNNGWAHFVLSMLNFTPRCFPSKAGLILNVGSVVWEWVMEAPLPPTQASKHLHWINYVVCFLCKHCTVGFLANEAILSIVFQTWQTLVENRIWSSETSSQQNWFDTKLWSHTSGTPNFQRALSVDRRSPFDSCYLHTHLIKGIYHARA